jgi:DnaA family protein
VSQQLPLNVTLRDGSSFANFHPGANQEAVTQVQAVAEGRVAGPLFIWGEPGTGKSHLLQAACRRAQEQGRDCAYLPLAAGGDLTPALFEEREEAALVCVDDVERIAGAREWQQALFALYERLRDRGGVFLAAGSANPNRLGLGMPELVTRLGAGLVYQLHPLSDADKVAALRLRARNRGLEMSEEVARYVLERYPRDMEAIFALLERLDRASLATQRRLTIPFIRGLRED